MANIQKQNTQLKSVDKLKSIINSKTVQEQFKNAMGKHSDLFTASLIDVFNDGLQNCDPASVITAALKAAVLKLPITKSLGFAYIIPYGGKAQFQIGYKGLIQLALRSGQLKSLNAGPIYPGEFVSFDRMFEILDITGSIKKGEPVGYFASMKLTNGFKKVVYWAREQVIEHAKKYSQSYSNKKSAWTTDFDAMATKTPLKFMLSHYAPMSIDFLLTIAEEDKAPSEPKDITDLTDQLGSVKLIPDNEDSLNDSESSQQPEFGQEK